MGAILKLDSPEALHELLTKNDCHPDQVIEGIAQDEIKAELIANTSEAVEKGAFGIPTFLLKMKCFMEKILLENSKKCPLEALIVEIY